MTRIASLVAVALVGQLVGEGVRLEALGDAGEGRVAHVVRGAPDAAVERGAREA